MRWANAFDDAEPAAIDELVPEADIAPGKVTRTMRLRPVQRRMAASDRAAASADPGAVVAAVASGGRPLPFYDQLAAAFAPYDLAGIRAHDGPDAAAAASAIGARAFATGDAVGFAEAPSLHTAAHEAVHVLQQRAGLVADGIGAADDHHERAADAIADRVVAGDHVGAALGDLLGSAAGAPSVAVQRRLHHGGRVIDSTTPPKKRLAFVAQHDQGDPARRHALEAWIFDDDDHTLDEFEAQWGGGAGRDEDDAAGLANDDDPMLGTSWGAPLEADDDGVADDAAAVVPRGRQPKDAQWRQHMAALRADLAALAVKLGEEVLDDRQRQVLDQVATCVLLYQAHVASFMDLNPAAADHETTRQEHPAERANPGFYFRSQAKDHPQFVMLKDLIVAATAWERGRILPPYNVAAEAFVNAGTAETTQAKKVTQVEHPEPDLTLRPAKTKGKKGHSELAAAHLGLRQTNAAAFMSAIDRFLAADDGVRRLATQLATMQRTMAGGAHEALDERPVTDHDLHVVLEQVSTCVGRLAAVGGGPIGDEDDGGADLDDEAALGEAMRAALEEHGVWFAPTEHGGVVVVTRTPDGRIEWADTPGRGDAYGSASFVTRKIGQHADRADRLLARLRCQYLRVGRVADNAQVTVEIPQEYKLNDNVTAGFTTAMRAYLAAEIMRAAARRDVPLAAQQRQSFGAIETTLADTGPSIRISIGTEPPRFFDAVAAALHTLDAQLAAAVARCAHDDGDQRAANLQQLYGQVGSQSRFKAIGSPALQQLLTLQVVIRQLDLAGMMTYIADRGDDGYGADAHRAATGATAVPTQGRKTTMPADRRAAIFDGLMARARGVLAGLPAVADDDRAADPDALPIVEPLHNALLMVGGVARRLLDGGDLADGLTPRVRRSAMTELQANLALVAQRLDDATRGGDGDQLDDDGGGFSELDPEPRPGPDRTHALIYADLRNATEDLVQALLLVLATTRAYLDQRPDAYAEHELRHTTGIDEVETFRTDSGEQSAAVALVALQAEARRENPKAGFTVGIDAGRTYFEYATLLSQNAIKTSNAKAVPNAVLIDPRPYVVRVPQDEAPRQSFAERIAAEIARSPEPKPGQPPRSIVIDTTGLDYADPVITDAIAAAGPAVAAGRVRFVTFNSGAKHEQNSADRYQFGRLAVFGAAVPGLRDWSESPLVTQLLAVLNELRQADATDLGGGDPAAAIDWSGYDAFMHLAPLAAPWREARARLDQASADDQAADVRGATDALLQLVQSTLADLASRLAHPERANQGAYDAFAALPLSEQRFVQRRVLELTGGGRASTGAKRGGAAPRPLPGHEVPLAANGIPNVGNSCYISAALNLIAFTEPYRQVFAPRDDDDGEEDPFRDVRARLWAVLTKIRAGAAVAPAEVIAIRADLNDLGCLLPPSIAEQQAGLDAEDIQQDPDEVFLRRVLPMFAAGGAHNLGVTERVITDFPEVDSTFVRAALDADYAADGYSEIPLDRRWREAEPAPVLALAIAECADLQAAIAQHTQAEPMVVRAIDDGAIVDAPANRRIEIVADAPDAFTVTLKRFDGVAKDEHPVAMPTQLDVFGDHYVLAAVIHHRTFDGSIDGGHYTASTPAQDGWVHRDDATVARMDPERTDARRDTGSVYSYVRAAAMAPLPIIGDGDVDHGGAPDRDGVDDDEPDRRGAPRSSDKRGDRERDPAVEQSRKRERPTGRAQPDGWQPRDASPPRRPPPPQARAEDPSPTRAKQQRRRRDRDVTGKPRKDR